MSTMQRLDVADLHRRVREVYQEVAESPDSTYHFEMGPGLARRLGYPEDLLNHIPVEALESFAGVGYFLDRRDPFHFCRQCGLVRPVHGIPKSLT